MEALAPDRPLAGRYVLLEPVAMGGMATVWRARDEVLARTVAVKVLRDDLATDPGLSERFRREAVSAARLTHAHIVSVFDAGEDQGRAFIVMEFFEGDTLGSVVQAKGPLSPPRAVAVAVPVLSALGFAHAQGVIHRDVKPANILIGVDGRVKVADFGIARAAYRDGGQEITTTGSLLGTVRYLSPEQVQGVEIDGRSDLYSLGVSLYEMLTGRPPFVAASDMGTAMMRLTADPLPPRAIRPEIPRDLEAIVLRAMAVRPDDRFADAETMRAALQRQATGSPTVLSRLTASLPPIRPASAKPAAPSRGSSFFRAWMLVPLVLLLVAGAAIGIGLALGLLEVGGTLGIRGADRSPAAPATASGEPLGIVAGQDYDPQGNDHRENGDQVPLAFDGDAATAWGTDHYSTASFGNLKDGVGLWLDLGAPVTVARVTVVSPISGWRFQLLAGTTREDARGPLASIDGRRSFDMGTSGRVSIDLTPTRTSGLLIWITRLGSDEGGFAAKIAEVRVGGTKA